MSRLALAEEMKQKDVLGSPKKVCDYLSLKLGNESREIFMVLFLDTQNRVQAQESLFEGMLTQARLPKRNRQKGLTLQCRQRNFCA
jgi:DNA repair protein RadC